MTYAFSQLNWLAIGLACVASVALAGVWFGAVVARAYLVVLGRDAAEDLPSSTVRSVGPIVCVVVTVLASAVLVAALELTTAGDAVLFGLVVGIGYQIA